MKGPWDHTPESKRPLRDYIERFDKEDTQIQGANKKMKTNLLSKGFLSDTKFIL
jgi:hypothetical protein